MFIESTSNPRVKAWSQLKTRKGRRQQGLFLVEGMRLVQDLLQSAFTIDAFLWDVGTDELPDSLQAQVLSRRIPLIELAPSVFAEIADTTTPQGVIAVAHIPTADSADFRAGEGLSDCAVLLDGLQDPGNVGTLIRTADAFGIAEVICGTGTADAYAPKVVRATMGGIFRVHVTEADSVDYMDKWLGRFPNGQVVVTAAGAKEPCYTANFRQPTLLVIGSEAAGVSQPVAQNATLAVQIPMAGSAESLNAAMAGSILLYEAYRQRTAD